MSINIQNLINRINNKVSALDSNSDLTEITRLNDLSNRISGDINEGAVRYRSSGQLPSTSLSDSAYDGQIAFVEDQQLDSNGRYFFRTKNGWINLNTLTDSDEDILIASSGGSGGSGPSYDGARQGTNYGYIHGGRTIPTLYNTIEKYSLSADANSTDVGDLTSIRIQMTGASYPTHGYVQGGYSTFQLDNIEKVSTSTDGNATDVANLTEPYRFGGGTQSATHGYTVGNIPASNLIQKHQFSNDGDGTDVGDLLANNNRCNGTSASETDGYLAGGYQPTDPTGDWTDRIQKFPFATDANSTDVGNLIHIRAYNAGTNGTTHGYSAGGQGGTPLSFAHDVTIEKYSYSTDGNSTDVGDLTVTASQAGHASSTTHGYQAGGSNPIVNVIQKYSFSSDGNATDVGDTLAARYDRTGTQY